MSCLKKNTRLVKLEKKTSGGGVDARKTKFGGGPAHTTTASFSSPLACDTG